MFNRGQEARALHTLSEVSKNLSAPLPRYGIRCPLGGYPTGNAGFWLSLLQRSMKVDIIPNVMWGNNTMLFYFNKLSVKGLTALWHNSWQDDTVCDLATTNMGEGTLIPMGQPLGDLL